MQTDYDSSANAISITIAAVQHADGSDEAHARAIVALAAGRSRSSFSIRTWGSASRSRLVADRYGLDREALCAAAQSALAAPDRVVSLEVAARATA